MNTQPAEKIRAGVIGFGKMGMIHSAALMMNPGSELCAILDTDAPLMKNLQATGFGSCFYTHLDQMLDHVELDVAFICTPNQTHLPIATQCLQKDLDIFVEMPLADSYASAVNMLQSAVQKKVLHAVGYTAPFDPVFQKTKELIDGQILGELRRFRASFFWSLSSEASEDWLLNKSISGGGIVLNTASSLLFLIHWLFGTAKSLTARTSHRMKEVEDNASIIMHFPEGLMGLVDISWNRPGYPYPTTSCVIEGSLGIMEVSDDFIKLFFYRKTKGFEKGWTIFDRSDLLSPSSFFLEKEGYYEGSRTFLECVRQRKPHSVSWEEGLEVMRTIEAIYRSARSKEVVPLKEVYSWNSSIK